MDDILQLSELHSQQIALLGYIQQDGVCWYVQSKASHLISLMPAGGDNMHAVNHTRSWYYVLTPDQSKAKPVK